MITPDDLANRQCLKSYDGEGNYKYTCAFALAFKVNNVEQAVYYFSIVSYVSMTTNQTLKGSFLPIIQVEESPPLCYDIEGGERECVYDIKSKLEFCNNETCDAPTSTLPTTNPLFLGKKFWMKVSITDDRFKTNWKLTFKNAFVFNIGSSFPLVSLSSRNLADGSLILGFRVPITATRLRLSVSSYLVDIKTNTRVLQSTPSNVAYSQGVSEMIDCIRKKNGVACDGTPEDPFLLYNLVNENNEVSYPVQTCSKEDQFLYYFKCMPKQCFTDLINLNKSGPSSLIEGTLNPALYLDAEKTEKGLKVNIY